MVIHGGQPLAEKALRALLAGTPAAAYEVVVVDNASPDGIRSWLANTIDGATLIFCDRNTGFGPASNAGAAAARARAVLFLNSDAFVHDGWLPPMLEALSGPRVAAVSPRVLNEDGTLQEAGCAIFRGGETTFVGFGDDPRSLAYAVPRDIDYGSGACLLVRRSAFERVGGFDPVYAPAYYEDVELCLELAARGWRCVYEPRAVVTHVRHASQDAEAAQARWRRNISIFRTRWQETLDRRPIASPVHALVPRDRLLLRARDAERPIRLLVVGRAETVAAAGNGVGRLFRALATRTRQASPAALFTDEPGASSRESLATSGIEVLGPSDVERLAWHFDVVIFSCVEAALRFGSLLAEAQPQARFALVLEEPGAGAQAARGLLRVEFRADIVFAKGEMDRAFLAAVAPEVEVVPGSFDITDLDSVLARLGLGPE
jgi:GT2 family glycosyltransferase